MLFILKAFKFMFLHSVIACEGFEKKNGSPKHNSLPSYSLIVFLKLLIKFGAKIGTHLSKIERPVISQYISFMLLEIHVPAGTKYSGQIADQNLPPQNICPLWLLGRVFKRFKNFFCMEFRYNIEKNKHEKIYIWFILGARSSSPNQLRLQLLHRSNHANPVTFRALMVHQEKPLCSKNPITYPLQPVHHHNPPKRGNKKYG